MNLLSYRVTKDDLPTSPTKSNLPPKKVSPRRRNNSMHESTGIFIRVKQGAISASANGILKSQESSFFQLSKLERQTFSPYHDQC